MSVIKKWVLFITPQTNIRTTQNENWIPIATDKYLLDFGAKKHKAAVAKGVKNPIQPTAYVNRKRTILRYWDYKKALKKEAERMLFEMPNKGAYIKFFLPMPKSWSVKKRKEMCFQLHESKPDCDNIVKGFFDSLVKKDQVISDYRASKFWYDGTGHIEITVGEISEAMGYTKIIREDKIK